MWVLLVLLLASVVLQVQPGVPQEHHPSEPNCSEPCIFGSCVGTDKCECFSGYKFLNGSKTVCKPTCSEDCGANARCTAPETCTCNEGFFRNDSFTECQPLCSRRCSNGICSGPNKCSCLEGYAEFLWYLCIPICSNHCLRGQCVTPNSCQCFTGYQPSPTQGSNICEPICSKDCGHGRCIAPEICLCDKGYEKRSAEGVCELQLDSNIITEPKCSSSSNNDTCKEPNSPLLADLNADTEKLNKI